MNTVIFTPLVVASTVSSWFPTFIGLRRFQKMDTAWKVIAGLFVFMFFVEIFGHYLTFFIKNNTWVYNVNLLVEGLVYMLVLSTWIQHKTAQRLFHLGSILFLGYWIVTFLFEPISTMPVHFSLFRGAVLVILASLVMIDRSRRSENNLLTDPEFLFATGILLYNSLGSLILGISGAPELVAGKSVLQMTFYIHSWVNIFSNLIYAFAIRCHQQRARFSS